MSHTLLWIIVVLVVGVLYPTAWDGQNIEGAVVTLLCVIVDVLRLAAWWEARKP